MQEFQPEFSNLVQFLAAACARYSDRPLLGMPQANDVAAIEWTSFTAFARAVDELRSGLHSLGVQRDDSVAVLSRNRLEWAVGAYATFGLGAHYVPLNPLAQDSWDYVLTDSEAAICLVETSEVARRLHEPASSSAKLRDVVTWGDSVPGSIDYSQLLEYGAAHPLPALIPSANDLAVLMYTSGTTGIPKAAMLSHVNLAANVCTVRTLSDLTPDDRSVAFVPWWHVYGLLALNLTIATGGSMAICSDGASVGELLPIVRPSVLFGMPRFWNAIVQLALPRMAADQPTQANQFAAIREALGGRLRVACTGGAALPPEVAACIDALGIALYEGYGLTETSGCATLHRYSRAHSGSVGKAIPGMRVSLDRTLGDAGADDGEVVLHGQGVARGYWKQPATWSYALTDDGGVRTGDLGRIDADGHLYLIDRIKSVYSLDNGVCIARDMLEEMLLLSPYILYAFVFGENRPYSVAIIVPDLLHIQRWAETHGIASDSQALLFAPKVRGLLESEVRRLNPRLSADEHVQRFVIEPEAPSLANGLMTPVMRPRRRVIRERYAPVFSALYAAPADGRGGPHGWHIRELLTATVNTT